MADAASLIEQGKRALNDGRKAEAQGLLLQATEVDESNAEAWLWLASAVDTEDEMRICLENVLVLDPDNPTAKQMLNELDRGSASSNPADAFADLGTTETAAVADAAPAADPAPASDDPFGSAFGESGFMDSDSDDSFGAGGPFSADFSFTAPVEEAPASTPPAAEAAPASPAAPVDDGFDALRDDSLFDDDEDEDTSGFSSGGFADDDDGFSAGSYADDDDYRYDDDDDYGYDDDGFDDDEDPLELLPPNVKPTRLPGTDEVASGGTPMAVVWVIGVLNVLALAALIAQRVL
ncbi:MAG: hypothetical protein AAFU54_06755 [Chloroflexota bacterium]